MKKFLPIMLVVLLIMTGVGAVATPSMFEKNVDATDSVSYGFDRDELDQYQLNSEFFAPVGRFPLNDLHYSVAQEFMPTKSVLTRVELFVGRNDTTSFDYVVSIRDSLSGADLTSVGVAASEFPIEDFAWVEFDFPDIMVTPGSSYYLVSSTENVSENYYAWSAVLSDQYPNGTIFASTDDEVTWMEEVEGDMTFKTYGRENSAPDAPVIDGTVNGKAGVEYDFTFVSTDPDGDDVYYWIVWGDGCPAVEWIGPYASGELVTVGHTFVDRGTYDIQAKARDIFEVESDFGYLEVTMPLLKYIDAIPLFALVQQHFPLIWQILKNVFG